MWSWVGLSDLFFFITFGIPSCWLADVRLHIGMKVWVALVHDWNFMEDSYCCGHVVDFYYNVFSSVSADEVMPSSVLGVVDDVHSTIDRKVSRSVDRYFSGRIVRCVGRRVCS